VDVLYGQGADHWISPKPRGLRDAALAWAAPFPNDKDNSSVLYQFQWNNPRPDVAIKSVDLKYDDKVGSRYGVPILLAITAANAVE
jgi:hypothetical protein